MNAEKHAAERRRMFNQGRRMMRLLREELQRVDQHREHLYRSISDLTALVELDAAHLASVDHQEIEE